MKGHIQKWGNSLAVRIPKGIAEEAELGASTPVNIEVTDGRVVITPMRSPRYSLEELVSGIHPDNLHEEVDWGPAQGREEW